MTRIRPNLKVFSGRPDLIPLITVMFLLLLFFVISSSLVFQAGVPVELPQAVKPDMRATDKIVITVTRNDLLFFNDKPVKWEELERELRELAYDSRKAATFRAGPGAPTGHAPAVLLRADRNVPYARIMEVVSLTRSLNLGVYMATALQQEPKPRLQAAAAPGGAAAGD